MLQRSLDRMSIEELRAECENHGFHDLLLVQSVSRDRSSLRKALLQALRIAAAALLRGRHLHALDPPRSLRLVRLSKRISCDLRSQDGCEGRAGRGGSFACSRNESSGVDRELEPQRSGSAAAQSDREERLRLQLLQQRLRQSQCQCGGPWR